jgi:hypothetical protein
MSRLGLGFISLACVLVLLVSGSWAQDDKKKEDPKPAAPAPRLKGQLPPNYRALGLTEQQKQAVYKIQDDYDVKLAALEEQIKKLKIEEKQAIDKVLTEAQRARLKEILKEKSGLDTGSEAKPKSEKP